MEYRVNQISECAGILCLKKENVTINYYTKKQIKHKYPHNNYKVLGEIGNKKGTPYETAKNQDGQLLPVYGIKSHHKLFERIDGYVAVDAHQYLAVVKNVFSGREKYIALFCSLIAVAFVSLLMTLFFFNPTTRMVNEVVSAVEAAEKSTHSFITINNKFSVTQNGKENINLNQGVYIKDEKTKQMAVAANLDFTSALNPENNYNLTLDIWKKNNKIYEKQGSHYVASEITAQEFNDAVKDYKIFKIQKSNIKNIEKVESVDTSSAIYQITLKKMDDSLVDQYLASISKQTGEAFGKKQIKKATAMIVTSLSDGVLKSQQLKFFIELKSVTNAIEMANVSEINVNLEEETVQNNFLGRIES